MTCDRPATSGPGLYKCYDGWVRVRGGGGGDKEGLAIDQRHRDLDHTRVMTGGLGLGVAPCSA